MILARCRIIAAVVALTVAAGQAHGEEMVGKVKSIDTTTNKVVVTDKSTDKDREITIDSSTSWTKEKKGKASKKFELSKLKVGSEVEVTSEGSLASRVVIKTPKKKKAKAV